MPDLTHMRTDVIGSLLRPDYLKEARYKFDEGSLSAAAFAAIEDQAVREAVGLQESVGLEILTDGEMRRLNFQESFGAAVDGFDASASKVKVYERRVEGASPLRRWEIPEMGGHGTAVAHRPPTVSRPSLKRHIPPDEYRAVAATATLPATR